MSNPSRQRDPLEKIPASLIFIGSAISNYSGTAIAAALLFSLMPAAAVAWFRGLVTAVFMLAWRRPFRKAMTLKELGVSTLFGMATLGMNMIFYEAVVRIPLGTSVSLEFIGPIAVAVAVGRGLKTRIATVLALAGVLSIGGLGMDISDPVQLVGVACAIGAGAMWAGYVVLGQKIATTRNGLDSLAVGMSAATIIFAPLVWRHIATPFIHGWQTVLIVIVMGILSSMIPYSVEQTNMKRLGKDTFALMLALYPATSTLVGLVVLFQVPNAGEIIGLICVSAAVALVNYNPQGRLARRRAQTKGAADQSGADTNKPSDNGTSDNGNGRTADPGQEGQL